MTTPSTDTAGFAESNSALRRYYRWQSKFYDLTRWTFLFGRGALVSELASHQPRRVLEVGCGTGRNLKPLLRRLPEAHITGLDLSESMLEIARRKTQRFGSRCELVQASYDRPISSEKPFDAVVLSYALTMFNPGYAEAIDAARQDLAPGGLITVVDFHDTPLGAFRKWMGLNHVRMEGHVLPELEQRFETVTRRVRRAYGGGWRYFLYVGRRPRPV